MATQQTVMKKCANKWSSGADQMGRTYRTHMKKCLRQKKGVGAKAASAAKRSTSAKRTKDPCANQCDQVVQKRVANGDRTPRATMKASCLRKCREKGPAAAAHSGAVASAPAVVKRDVKALCNRYCIGKPDKPGCERQCNDGQVGPGRLAAKLVEQKAGTPVSLMNRFLKHKVRAERKMAGAARRAAQAVKQAVRRGAPQRGDWGRVESARKTIGRRPR